MKFNFNTLKGFGIGVIVTSIIASNGIFSYASTKAQQINVAMGGIKIFVDGKLQVPIDVNGNEIEPFVYAGTTYLPVRALTGMLTDKPVEWDANSQSVYIGLKPGSEEVIKADELKSYTGNELAVTGIRAQFKLLNEVQTPFNRYISGKTVKLDGMYTELNGEFVARQTKLGDKYAAKLSIYAVDQYGNKNLIDSYELKSGDEPISVKTNISGCDYLCIETNYKRHDEGGYTYYGEFYNVTFTKASGN